MTYIFGICFNLQVKNNFSGYLSLKKSALHYIVKKVILRVIKDILLGNKNFTKDNNVH